MAWHVWLCDTITGEDRIRVNPASTSWQRVLRAVGGGSSSFHLGDPLVAEVMTRARTTPLATTLVVDWDGVVVYAGIVWGRGRDFTNQTLTLTHRDIWSVFPKRLVVTTNTKGVEKTTLRIPALGEPTVSLATLAKHIVFEGTDAADPMFRLPITYAPDAAGPYSKKYPGYAVPTVEESLRDVLDANAGFDVDFQPEWNEDGHLRWVMRTGALSGNTVSWNVGAGKSGVFNLDWSEDANKIANNVLTIGEGSERDMLVGAARNTDSPYPAMEYVGSYKSEKSVDQLDKIAAEHLRVYGQPTEQWSASIHASGVPGATDLKIGGTARLHFQDDPWEPDGWQQHRIIGYSGDLSETVNLDFQPTGGL